MLRVFQDSAVTLAAVCQDTVEYPGIVGFPEFPVTVGTQDILENPGILEFQGTVDRMGCPLQVQAGTQVIPVSAVIPACRVIRVIAAQADFQDILGTVAYQGSVDFQEADSAGIPDLVVFQDQAVIQGIRESQVSPDSAVIQAVAFPVIQGSLEFLVTLGSLVIPEYLVILVFPDSSEFPDSVVTQGIQGRPGLAVIRVNRDSAATLGIREFQAFQVIAVTLEYRVSVAIRVSVAAVSAGILDIVGSAGILGILEIQACRWFIQMHRCP